MPKVIPERIYAQYADKPKTLAFLRLYDGHFNDLYNVIMQVANSYNIDTADSYSLDVLGNIVGVDRSYESQLLAPTFQCGDTNVQCGEPAVQCASATISVDVSDDYFRILIKMKIAKNNGGTSLDDIARAVEFGFGDSLVRVVDNEDMTFNIEFSRPLEKIEKDILDKFDVIPTPQAVKFAGYVEP